MLLLWPIITSINIIKVKGEECYYRFTIYYGEGSCFFQIFINKSENLIRMRDVFVINSISFCGIGKTHHLRSLRTLFRWDYDYYREDDLITKWDENRITEHVNGFSGCKILKVYKR